MQLDMRYASHPTDAMHYTTAQLREHYLIPQLFQADEALLTYSHFDRIIAGGAMPVYQTIALTGCPEMAANHFLQRREMGLFNLGGLGSITVDGVDYAMNTRDALYVGMGAETILLQSHDAQSPAKFYMNTCPAHTTYPTMHITRQKAARRELGTAEGCNKRTIYQYIHPDVLQSCQLCMGLTELAPGSNWNTMPSHTHERRMEVYCYFDLGSQDVVFHMMGEPQETRHLVVRNEQAVISPSWSIHSGVATCNYTFIWGMCGENKTFDDMDSVAMDALR